MGSMRFQNEERGEASSYKVWYHTVQPPQVPQLVPRLRRGRDHRSGAVAHSERVSIHTTHSLNKARCDSFRSFVAASCS